MLLWICVAPIFLVCAKYWLWERTLHSGETGYRAEMSSIGRTYADALELIYSPSIAIVRPLSRRLPVGGAAIDLAADLVAVGLQYVFLLFIWRSWQANRHRRGCAQRARSQRKPELRNSTQGIESAGVSIDIGACG